MKSIGNALLLRQKEPPLLLREHLWQRIRYGLTSSNETTTSAVSIPLGRKTLSIHMLHMHQKEVIAISWKNVAVTSINELATLRFLLVTLHALSIATRCSRTTCLGADCGHRLIDSCSGFFSVWNNQMALYALFRNGIHVPLTTKNDRLPTDMMNCVWWFNPMIKRQALNGNQVPQTPHRGC